MKYVCLSIYILDYLPVYPSISNIPDRINPCLAPPALPMEIPPPANTRGNFGELVLYANNVQKHILASK